MSGVVFDPDYIEVHEEIRTEVRQRNLDGVVDTWLMELATPTGLHRSSSHPALGDARPHTMTVRATRSARWLGPNPAPHTQWCPGGAS